MTQPATASKPPVTPLRRFINRLPRIIVTVYLIMCCLAYLAQDWMAFPGWSDQGKPETKITFGGDAEVVHFTTDNHIPITAVFGVARKPDNSEYTPADHRPTVMYFYGNASAAAFSQGEFDHLRRAGCNVLIPDMPGYGESGGKPSEANFYAAADAAWNYLQNKPGVDGKKIIVLGWSMGAGPAVDLANRKPVLGLATLNA
jgi:pimeloyl-ACP methyl ester carboxylesterase